MYRYLQAQSYFHHFQLTSISRFGVFSFTAAQTWLPIWQHSRQATLAVSHLRPFVLKMFTSEDFMMQPGKLKL
jgi:hypothetical protein